MEKIKAKKKTRRGLTFGVILFTLVLIYLAYHVVTYFSKEQVSIYSVGEKVSLAQNSTYTGLILREETVVKSAGSGYINYYIENSGRCSLNSIVYSIDENGSFNNMLSSGDVKSNLKSENLSELTSDLSNFSKSYNSSDFKEVYELKNSINNKLLGFLNIGSQDALKELGVDVKYFHTYKAGHIGIVEYYTDGYESLNKTSVTADLFDTDSYEKKVLKGGEVVSTESDAYKIITSESWSIVVPLTEEDISFFNGQTRVDVIFNETGIKTTVAFEEFNGADGKVYGLLTTSKYMVQYAGNRFLSITLDKNVEQGLKIPNTSVCTKDFYMIPLDYFAEGGNTNEKGLFVTTVSVDGTSASFIATDIFYKDESYAYISQDQLTLGSIIAKPDSEERFAVSATGTLKGVYCVNKGYAVFKVIEIIDENSDYLIVKSGTTYGIAVHDHILLNASLASEGDKIY